MELSKCHCFTSNAERSAWVAGYAQRRKKAKTVPVTTVTLASLSANRRSKRGSHEFEGHWYGTHRWLHCRRQSAMAKAAEKEGKMSKWEAVGKSVRSSSPARAARVYALRALPFVLLLLHVIASVAGATPTTINARSVNALPDTTAVVPISIVLPAGTSCATLQFNLTVVPNDGAPAVATNVTFTSLVGAPSINMNNGPASALVGWFSPLSSSLVGTMQIGTLSVPIPASAQPGNTYAVTVINPSGTTEGGTGLPMSGVNGVVTIGVPTSACVGDCNRHGAVAVDDILTMVNIALGNTPVTACDAGDANQDGQVTVDEILTAVNNALNGCSTSPPPTPTKLTPTSTPPPPPATNTPRPSARPTSTSTQPGATNTPTPTATVPTGASTCETGQVDCIVIEAAENFEEPDLLGGTKCRLRLRLRNTSSFDASFVFLYNGFGTDGLLRAAAVDSSGPIAPGGTQTVESDWVYFGVSAEGCSEIASCAINREQSVGVPCL